MPTGFTSSVCSGKVSDLKTFIIMCAKAFGPCYSQREGDLTAPIHEVAVSDYHQNGIKTAKDALDLLARMSEDEAAIACQEEYEIRLKRDAERVAEMAETEHRLRAMLSMAKRWNPPPAMVYLKKFMLDQLDSTITHDIFSIDPVAPKGDTQKWLKDKASELEKSMDYHERELKGDVDRIAGVNAWIRALNAELGKI